MTEVDAAVQRVENRERNGEVHGDPERALKPRFRPASQQHEDSGQRDGDGKQDAADGHTELRILLVVARQTAEPEREPDGEALDKQPEVICGFHENRG